MKPPQIKIRVETETGYSEHTISARRGESLREVLLRNKLSPYQGAFQRLNCHGLGICGSCLVQVNEAGVWGMRRSCQIQCFRDMEIQLQCDVNNEEVSQI